MGQIYSVVNIIVYPVITVYTGVFCNKINDIDPNIHIIREFNGDFADKKDHLDELKKLLYGPTASSLINNVNHQFIFPYTDFLNKTLTSEDLDGTQETKRQRFIMILEKIMTIYSTNETQFDDLKKTAEISFEQFFLNHKSNIEHNIVNSKNMPPRIQRELNSHDGETNKDFKTSLNNIFSNDEMKKISIVQYLNILLEMVSELELEVNRHIKFFEQKEKGFGGHLYDYTAGWFTWLSRSGYSYRATALFYTHWKKHSLKNLKESIEIKKTSFVLSDNTLTIIKKESKYLEFNILEMSDQLHIQFTINNITKDINIRMGNYVTESYESLCEDIQQKINIEKNNLNLQNFEFKISFGFEDRDDFKNHVVMTSNVPFTIKGTSTIMKILGWNQIRDCRSDKIINDENAIVGYINTSRTLLYNDQLNNRIPFIQRSNTIKANITAFNQSMNMANT